MHHHIHSKSIHDLSLRRRISLDTFWFLAIFAGTVLISGCTSSVIDPAKVLQTKKTPKEFVSCISIVLKKKEILASISGSHDRYRVSINGKITTNQTLEIYKTANTTEISLYSDHLSKLLPYENTLSRLADECH